MENQENKKVLAARQTFEALAKAKAMKSNNADDVFLFCPYGVSFNQHICVVKMTSI